MIKYLELTAPKSDEFRQVKILSVEVSEGASVKQGDTLFKVQSGKSSIDLPSTLDGKIIEVIAVVGEVISSITSLVLLETEVAESTASTPINETVSNSDLLGDVAKNQADISFSGTNVSSNKVKNKSEKNLNQQKLNLDSKSISNRDVPDNIIKINLPDIGTDSAKVIEVFVKVGDRLAINDPIISLESDKASMDVPSTHNGVVTSISVEVEQDINEGTLILELSNEDLSSEKVSPAKNKTSSSGENLQNIIIPDIGGDSAKVIEILVEAGQHVSKEDPLITLESDKASMEVPSSASGTVRSIEVKIDQEVSEGVVIAKLALTEGSDVVNSPVVKETVSVADQQETKSKAETIIQTPPETSAVSPTGKSHASPSIRRFARELGVDLSRLLGTGRKGRIVRDDVTQFIKNIMSGQSQAASQGVSGAGIPSIPAVDFTRFGEIDIQPLNKIKRLTAANLHRSWLNVPHVTHNDESDISDLEAFRKQLNSEFAKQKKNVKLSPLAFIVKAVVQALQTYPQFNSSLEPGGENLIYKKYINIGIAVETPNGLVVPVLRDADQKSVSEIALEMGELAGKARDKKLTMKDMSGACFTISSLGGIGGTSFTPIVNSPEVAILGVSRTKTQAIWDGKSFKPGLILPLSLSYDHRVIDGAEAARFTRQIAAVLEDVRRLTV